MNKCFPPGWAPALGLLGSGLARLGFQGFTQGHIRASPASSLEGTHEPRETEVSEQEQSQLATMECQGDCSASSRPPRCSQVVTGCRDQLGVHTVRLPAPGGTLHTSPLHATQRLLLICDPTLSQQHKPVRAASPGDPARQ